MRFFTFVLKNIARRRFRATFTVVGVGLAVGAVVALVGMSSGFESSLASLYRQRGIDVMVVRAGVTQRLTSLLDQRIETTLEALPGVKEVGPELLDVVSFEDLNLIGVTVYGWRPGSIEFKHLKLLEGRTLKPSDKREVLIGTLLAKNLGKKVGDTLDIYDSRGFKVVGTFQSFSMYENGALIVPLAELQQVTNHQGRVTLLNIVVTDQADRTVVDRLIKQIDEMGKGLKAMTTGDYVASDAQIQLGQGMAWFTSVVALIIGTVGVLNTMVMTVLERTREIGLLRAIGWRRSRVMQLILFESVSLSIVGAICGSVGALVLCRFLSQLPRTNGLISGDISPGVIVEGFLISLVVGFIGGAYPAWRGSQLPPTKALYHE